MTDSELEARLRAARPLESEIAPLTPERSAAILARALAANRKKDGGIMMPFLLPGWRPTLAAAFAALGAVFIFRLTGVPLPVTEGTVPVRTRTPSPAIVQEESHPERAIVGDTVEKPPMTMPVAENKNLGLTQKRIRRALPPATVIPIVSHTLWANAGRPRMAHQKAALPEASLPKAAALKSVTAPEEDGPLLVAASGVPDDDSGELRIKVQENVPHNVPGRAEAASVRLYADTPYQAAPTDYWAHARIATDSEPTLTLTALR